LDKFNDGFYPIAGLIEFNSKDDKL